MSLNTSRPTLLCVYVIWSTRYIIYSTWWYTIFSYACYQTMFFFAPHLWVSMFCSISKLILMNCNHDLTSVFFCILRANRVIDVLTMLNTSTILQVISLLWNCSIFLYIRVGCFSIVEPDPLPESLPIFQRLQVQKDHYMCSSSIQRSCQLLHFWMILHPLLQTLHILWNQNNLFH